MYSFSNACTAVCKITPHQKSCTVWNLPLKMNVHHLLRRPCKWLLKMHTLFVFVPKWVKLLRIFPVFWILVQQIWRAKYRTSFRNRYVFVLEIPRALSLEPTECSHQAHSGSFSPGPNPIGWERARYLFHVHYALIIWKEVGVVMQFKLWIKTSTSNKSCYLAEITFRSHIYLIMSRAES